VLQLFGICCKGDELMHKSPLSSSLFQVTIKVREKRLKDMDKANMVRVTTREVSS
jgi:hypothetical protein